MQHAQAQHIAVWENDPHMIVVMNAKIASASINSIIVKPAVEERRAVIWSAPAA